MVLPAILGSGIGSADAIALARFEYPPRRRAADQGGPYQPCAVAPGQAAVAWPTPLLFVPVSGEFGMGECARSLAIAQGAAQRWPQASIRFILSRAAPYAAQSPFPAALLASSPTFHSAAVIEIMNAWRPNIVIFDNAGRTAQLRAARNIGARVGYISARRRQRNTACLL